MLYALSQLILIAAIIGLVFLWVRSFDYQCERCGEKFSIPFPSSIFAPHWMGKKYVRCPRCGILTWATAVPKEKR